MDSQAFRRLVSGATRGLLPAMLRALLAAAEFPYGRAVAWRNRRYDQRRAEIHRLPLPVVSIGNLTLGGTGKTPLVAHLAAHLNERGARPAIVSRGYGSRSGCLNDEALELADRLPQVPHFQDPDRVAAGRRALAAGAGALLLDDAFQHRRIARDLDLVLLDALDPFGQGRLFPRGLLREPPAALARAHAVILSRADLLPAGERLALREQVARLAPRADWLEMRQAPIGWRSGAGEFLPLENPPPGRCAAFCGLGNPAGFEQTLASLPLQLHAWRTFPDHHPYTPADLTALTAWGNALRCDWLACTHKDLVKLRELPGGGLPVWALEIGVEWLAGAELLEARLAALFGAQSAPLRRSA